LNEVPQGSSVGRVFEKLHAAWRKWRADRREDAIEREQRKAVTHDDGHTVGTDPTNLGNRSTGSLP
jgi:hypothetical protein